MAAANWLIVTSSVWQQWDVTIMAYGNKANINSSHVAASTVMAAVISMWPKHQCNVMAMKANDCVYQ